MVTVSIESPRDRDSWVLLLQTDYCSPDEHGSQRYSCRNWRTIYAVWMLHDDSGKNSA